MQSTLGDILGQPVEPDHAGIQDCDTEQLTTTGLAYFTCATSMAGFVSATVGQRHWALVDGSLVEWLGEPVTPPIGTNRYALPGILTLTCVGPNGDPQHACVLMGGLATTAGLIDTPGTDQVYAFTVPGDAAPVEVQLTDLPADYDLYVVDGTGSVVGQSANEGLQPEIVDAVLRSGTYFAYVHSDPGRDVAPDSVFVLHVDPNVAPATASSSADPTVAP